MKLRFPESIADRFPMRRDRLAFIRRIVTGDVGHCLLMFIFEVFAVTQKVSRPINGTAAARRIDGPADSC